jgi:hypothetical protein
MASISEKIKRALADIEVVRKALNAVDEDHAEAEAVKRILEARQAELVETQTRLETSKAELVKADANHARWREAVAKQQLDCNKAIDVLQAKRQELEQQVADAQARFDNIIAGIAALSQRPKVG